MKEEIKDNINVLFVAMEFAPINTTGNFRSLKFVKYLREFGVEPIVLTFDIEDGKKVFSAKIDKDLLHEIPEGTNIYRFPVKPLNAFFKHRIGEFLKIFLFKDEGLAKRWANPKFWKQLDNITKIHNPKAVYVSLPPFSAGDLGIDISKRYDLPLIVDMRDHWSQWSNSPFQTRLHYKRTLKQERKIFKHATKILGVTKELNKDFQKVHPHIEKEKFVIIPNGYDFDLKKEANKIVVPKIENKTTFVIGYIGSFYYSPDAQYQIDTPWQKRVGRKKLFYTPRKENWLYRSPYFFLKALAELFEKQPALKSKVRFEHIGRKPEWLNQMLEKFNLIDNFFSHGFVSYKRVLEIQNSFDALLATSEKVIGGQHYCLPSKVFDYLRAAKPIIGFFTEGTQKDFFHNLGTAIICDPDNTQKAAEQLEQVICGNYELNINTSFLAKFHRQVLTKKLAKVFYQIELLNLKR